MNAAQEDSCFMLFEMMLEDVKEINVWKDTMVKVFWISQLMISSNICQAQRMRRDRARFPHTPPSLPPSLPALFFCLSYAIMWGHFLPSLAPVFFCLELLSCLHHHHHHHQHYFHFILVFLAAFVLEIQISLPPGSLRIVTDRPDRPPEPLLRGGGEDGEEGLGQHQAFFLLFL